MCSDQSKEEMDKKLRKLNLESKDVYRGTSSTFWDLTIVGEVGWIFCNFYGELNDWLQFACHCLYFCHGGQSVLSSWILFFWHWTWICDLVWPMKCRQKLQSAYSGLTLLYFCHHHNNITIISMSQFAWSQRRMRGEQRTALPTTLRQATEPFQQPIRSRVRNQCLWLCALRVLVLIQTQSYLTKIL